MYDEYKEDISMFTNDFIKQAAAEVHDYVIEMRREMHKRAEIGGHCVRAGAFIKEQLDAIHQKRKK